MERRGSWLRGKRRPVWQYWWGDGMYEIAELQFEERLKEDEIAETLKEIEEIKNLAEQI